MTAGPEDFQALFARVLEGSQDAAWEIVRRYGDHIRAVVRRRMHPGLRAFVDSEDFVQSVWGSLIRVGPSLRSIDKPEQLVALLSRMAQNKVIDEVRRRTRTQKHQLARHGETSDLEGAKSVSGNEPDASPSQFAIAKERWEQMLEGENPAARQMIQLRLAGHTYLEIAARLGVSERTVRRLIEKLGDKDPDPEDF